MAENMAQAPDHQPNQKFLTPYGKWADGNWGMILTGEHLTSTPVNIFTVLIMVQGMYKSAIFTWVDRMTLRYYQRRQKTPRKPRKKLGKRGQRLVSAQEPRR